MIYEGLAIGTALGLMFAPASEAFAGLTLYEQDFEAPVGFVFGQSFTTETLLVGGTQAFGFAQRSALEKRRPNRPSNGDLEALSVALDQLVKQTCF